MRPLLCSRQLSYLYRIHTRAAIEGLVVTRYKKNRVAMEAREDFYKLALEIGAGKKGR